MEGWIKLYRKFSEWEWFNISEMVHLFIYLLLNANHEPGKWRGIKIERGQILTGLNSLHEKTGISIRTLRTCLDRLQNTKEIDRQMTNRYSIITICNYESYQGEKMNYDKQADKQATSKRQASDKQATTNNNNKENKEFKNEKKFIAPTLSDVILYFKENGYSEESGRKAYQYYTIMNWIDSKGHQVKNWKGKMLSVWFKPENLDRSEPELIEPPIPEIYAKLSRQ
jgi:hypothetical protein